MSSSSSPSTRRHGRRLARWAVLVVTASVVATLRERAFAKNREQNPLVVPVIAAGAASE